MPRTESEKISPFEQARRRGQTESDSVFRPGDNFLRAERDRIIERMLSQPVAYMESDQLHEPDAEERLFEDVDPIPEPDISWYHPVMSELGLPGDRKSRGRNRKRAEVMRLSGRQERALFYQLNYARYRVRELQDSLGVSEDRPPHRRPTREEENRLIVWGTRAEQLREQIAETNVGLVLAMVRRTSLKNVDVADLVSEGNMALLRAIDKFNPDYGFKFSTYACQSILKAFSRLAHKESRLKDRFPIEFDPDMEESGWSQGQRNALEEDCAAEVADIVRTNRCNLTDVELRVVRHRFGFDLDADHDPDDVLRNHSAGKSEHDLSRARRMTLGEVGQMIGVGKERVRQIQVKALNKIRQELELGFLARRSDTEPSLEKDFSRWN
jgi:RNA polymerase sigma factor (sigma-70 family)